jgi:hypothetical protein
MVIAKAMGQEEWGNSEGKRATAMIERRRSINQLQ